MVIARSAHRRAFSLIELVIVVVIIGIIAAIAIPRMSRGSAGAADSTLVANLKVMRNAIDLFSTEHNNTYPSLANLPNALMQCSDDAGTAFNATRSATYIWGPYIREIPKLPVGGNKGSNTIAAAYAAGVGWVYTASTGAIIAGTTTGEIDQRGTLWNTY